VRLTLELRRDRSTAQILGKSPNLSRSPLPILVQWDAEAADVSPCRGVASGDIEGGAGGR
jgi:hypothetical protein